MSADSVKGMVKKDGRFAEIQQQMEALKQREQELKAQRANEIGAIFVKLGLAELNDAVFYGLADRLRAEATDSNWTRDFQLQGEKIMPKQAGRKNRKPSSAA